MQGRKIEATGGIHSIEGLAAANTGLIQIQTNAFDRSDPDTGAAGIFLDPVLAMANHSCIPNAFICFSGRNAILRAEDTIREGDEVEISYTGKLLIRRLSSSGH